jgi:hypothetical protein
VSQDGRLICRLCGSASTTTGPPPAGMCATATVSARVAGSRVLSDATTRTFWSPFCPAPSTIALEARSIAPASRMPESSHRFVPYPRPPAASTSSVSDAATNRTANRPSRRPRGTGGACGSGSERDRSIPACAAVIRTSDSSIRLTASAREPSSACRRVIRVSSGSWVSGRTTAVRSTGAGSGRTTAVASAGSGRGRGARVGRAVVGAAALSTGPR